VATAAHPSPEGRGGGGEKQEEKKGRRRRRREGLLRCRGRSAKMMISYK